MQPTNSRDALSELQSFQSSRRKPQDVLKESETRLGIPSVQQRQVGLRAAIGNTENLIKAVDPSVSGRTSGSLVTDAQKQRLINIEREPLGQQFSDQSRSLADETANLSELNRRALTESQLALSEDDSRQNSLQGLYSTLYQREQDDIARQERERAFQAQQEEARRAAASSANLASLFAGAGQPQAKPQQTEAPEAPDQNTQNLFNSVKNLLTKDPNRIQREAQAIRTSASYGNTNDKIKLQLLAQLKPEWFKTGVPSAVLGNASQLRF